jgi:hypothetical protein
MAILIEKAEGYRRALQSSTLPHQSRFDSCFDAFSLREPVSTSLENAMDSLHGCPQRRSHVMTMTCNEGVS